MGGGDGVGRGRLGPARVGRRLHGVGRLGWPDPRSVRRRFGRRAGRAGHDPVHDRPGRRPGRGGPLRRTAGDGRPVHRPTRGVVPGRGGVGPRLVAGPPGRRRTDVPQPARRRPAAGGRDDARRRDDGRRDHVPRLRRDRRVRRRAGGGHGRRPDGPAAGPWHARRADVPPRDADGRLPQRPALGRARAAAAGGRPRGAAAGERPRTASRWSTSTSAPATTGPS